MSSLDRITRELQFHLDQRVEELMAAGVDAAEARRRAAAELGGLEPVREECHQGRPARVAADFAADLGYAARALRHSRGFALVAIAILALGIGANTVVFSILESALLRPLPYRAPARLLWLTEVDNHGADQSFSVPDFLDFQRQNTVFSALGGYRDFGYALRGGGAGETRLLPGRLVTRGLFEALGVAPELGRIFSDREHQRNGARVALISDGLWSAYFDRDPRVPGRALQTPTGPLIVVGVMPPSFQFGDGAQIWTPYEQSVPDLYLKDRADSFILYGIGRLKPGVTLTAARAQLAALSQRLARQYPQSNAVVRAQAEPLRQHLIRGVRPSLLLLFAAVTLVVLIVCANLASLLLARAAGRARELAVRVAIGAGRGRIARQLLAESLLLCTLGGGLGLALAAWGIRAAAGLLPAGFPMVGRLHLDLPLLAYASLLALATGLLFSLAPLIFTLRTDLNAALKDSGPQHSGGRHHVHAALVVSEMAMAMALLAGAGLMIRSLVALDRVHLGFNPSHVLTARVALASSNYGSLAPRARFFSQLAAQAGALPGVQSAAVVFPVPYSPQIAECFIAIAGRVRNLSQPRTSYYASVDAGYFATMQIPLLAGRGFQPADDAMTAAPVVVVDQGLAEQYWGSVASAVGRRMQMFTQDFGTGPIPPATIVGVVGRVKSEAADKVANPEVYTPLNRANYYMSLVVRTSGNPQALAPAVRKLVHGLDAGLALPEPRPLDELVAASESTRTLSMRLLAAFAAIAMLLAALGLYGVLAFWARQRRRELGIRMAFGADRDRIVRLIVGHGLRLALLGLVVGGAGTLLLAPFASSLLFGVTPRDPLTWTVVAAVLLLVALLASYLPARRAASLDPLAVLRSD